MYEENAYNLQVIEIFSILSNMFSHQIHDYTKNKQSWRSWLDLTNKKETNRFLEYYNTYITAQN